MKTNASILVVDDNQDDREHYIRLLAKMPDAGYRCVEASDGKSGIALLGQNDYDCVLLDYSLPGADGVQVLREMRQQHPFLPIIMFTGQGNETVAVDAMKHGAFNYLVKSTINPENLHRTIQEGIARGTLEKTVAEKDQQLLQKTRDLEQSVTKLMQSNAELERFAYVASHDMQEPIRMVTNFSQIIANDFKEMLDDSAQEYLAMVIEAGNRMREMIEDLLDYSRINEGDARTQKFDGNAVLESALTNLTHLTSEKKAHVTHDALPHVNGNPIQIMRLLQNLIGNGIKYQAEGNTPRIHVSVDEQDQHWCFSVRDNGLGIRPEFTKQVFEPFWRLHTYHEIHGTGLGLAICRKIVESHGGTIWVESVPGEGSTFYFTLAKQSTLPMEKAA